MIISFLILIISINQPWIRFMNMNETAIKEYELSLSEHSCFMSPEFCSSKYLKNRRYCNSMEKLYHAEFSFFLCTGLALIFQIL